MHTQPSGSPLLSDAGLYSLACCFYNLPTLKIKPLLLPSPGLRRFPGHPPPWLLGSHQGLSSGQMQPHSSGLGLGSCLCCGTLSPCHPVYYLEFILTADWDLIFWIQERLWLWGVFFSCNAGKQRHQTFWDFLPVFGPGSGFPASKQSCMDKPLTLKAQDWKCEVFPRSDD